MKLRALLLGIVTALVAAIPVVASADPNIASLRGVLRADPTDAPERFKGTIVDLTSNLGAFHARADGVGSYIIFGIPSGRWVLTVEKAGFQPISKVVCVRAGQDRTLDVRLKRYHVDFAFMPKTAALNSLEIQPSETSDLYSLGTCD